MGPAPPCASRLLHEACLHVLLQSALEGHASHYKQDAALEHPLSICSGMACVLCTSLVA